jgi:hypothetical protein
LRSGLFQAGGVLLPQKLSVFPFSHTKNYQLPIATAKTVGDRWGDMLIQEKLKHLTPSVTF